MYLIIIIYMYNFSCVNIEESQFRVIRFQVAGNVSITTIEHIHFQSFK